MEPEAGRQAAVADPLALVATGAAVLRTARVAVVDVEAVEVAVPSVAASVVTVAVPAAVVEGADFEAERVRVVLPLQLQEASHRPMTTSPSLISDTPSSIC